MGKDLWLVGKYDDLGNGKTVLNLRGVFDSELEALKACSKSDLWITKIELNRTYPIELVKRKYAYFPVVTKDVEYDKNGSFIKVNKKIVGKKGR